MFAAESMPLPKPRHSSAGHKLLITQQEQLNYFCQLILSCYFLSGATPLLADQGLTTLSKAFRPHIYDFSIFP